MAVRPFHIRTMLDRTCSKLFSQTYLTRSPQHALLPAKVPLQLWPRGLAALVPQKGRSLA